MPGKKAAEFTWIEDKGLYRKRVKNPHTGKWHDIYGKTKDEIRANVRAQAEQWDEAAAAAENPQVYQYCATWYELNTATLTPKTKEGISNCINNHICPVIGGMRMRDVTNDDARRVMAACSAMSNESQKKILNVLRRVFDAAELSNIVQRSPVKGIKAGGDKTAEKVPLTREQQTALVEAIKETRCWPFVMLCLYAGLRREEALGLKWDCVHLDAQTPYLAVRRKLVWVSNKPVVSETLKSPAARRDIPLPPQLIDCLRHLDRSASGHVISDTNGQPMTHQSYRIMWDAVKARTERVVTEQQDGKPVERKLCVGDKVRNKSIYISLDFAVTPHQLRHTYITELILAGANVKTVQYLAGHSSVQLTLDIYTHLVDKQPEFTVSAVLDAFAPDEVNKNALGVQMGVQSICKNQQSIDNTMCS